MPRFVKNGLLNSIKINNFADTIPLGHIFREQLSIPYGTVDVTVQKVTRQNVDFLLIQTIFEQGLLCSLEYAVSMKNETPEKWEMWRGHRDPSGEPWELERTIRMDSITDPDSGFLKNGGLELQVEVRVDFFSSYDGQRSFNFCDPLDEGVKIVFESEERDVDPLYADKKMLMFHSPVLAKELAAGATEMVVSKWRSEAFEVFLHIIHGGRQMDGPFQEYTHLHLIDMAYRLNVPTVMRQCEQFCRRLDENKDFGRNMFFCELVYTLPQSKRFLEEICEKRFQRPMNEWETEMIEPKEMKELLIATTRIPFEDTPISHLLSFVSTSNFAQGE